MTLPNELVAQLDGQKSFEEMTTEEKLREINWCIARCEMNAEDENTRYYKIQINKLNNLKRRFNYDNDSLEKVKK